MKILITNDDGIDALGIRLLAEWAKKLGEVTVVAPKTEQSAKSHAIELSKPVEIKKVDFMEGVTAYAMDSTPADCIRFGQGRGIQPTGSCLRWFIESTYQSGYRNVPLGLSGAWRAF